MKTFLRPVLTAAVCMLVFMAHAQTRQAEGLSGIPGPSLVSPTITPRFNGTTTVDSTGNPLLPVVSVRVDSHPAVGEIFLSPFAINQTPVSSYLLLIANDGSIGFQRQMTAECTDFKPIANGHYLYYDAGMEAFCEIDPSLPIVQRIYACQDGGYHTNPHDIQVLPNGHVLLMGDDYEFIDMSAVVPGGDPQAVVVGLVIQELDAQNNIVFQWNSWDHFNITDATYEDLTQPMIDYVHGNSIQLDTDGNILLSSRHMDEVTKISRQTGDILWRWGGKHNQFRFVNDSLGFSHQHDVRRIANGDITLFDNGNYHAVQQSRACEYRLDETTMTATLVWQYSNPLGTYSASMGSVQRLDNGNTLIGWGSSSSPAVTEVTPQGVKAFEMSLPDNTISYRAYRYNIVSSVNTTPTVPLVPDVYALDQNFPNPFNPSTTINYALPSDDQVMLRIYDMIGREVTTLVDRRQSAGQYSVQFDASHLPSGVYFYRLSTAHFSQVRKMILQK